MGLKKAGGSPLYGANISPSGQAKRGKERATRRAGCDLCATFAATPSGPLRPPIAPLAPPITSCAACSPRLRLCSAPPAHPPRTPLAPPSRPPRAPLAYGSAALRARPPSPTARGRSHAPPAPRAGARGAGGAGRWRGKKSPPAVC